MCNFWFTADTHFSHYNILKYSKRDFKNVLDMNESLINNWNSKIKNGDTVYHLGDFAFDSINNIKQIVSRLNGEIFLIKGNHDKFSNGQLYDCGFKWVGDYKKITIKTQKIILSHYAMRAWDNSHYGSWMLYGHSHNTLRDHYYISGDEYVKIQKTMDVGVDVNNYYPFSFDEIQKIMNSHSISYENEKVENELKCKKDY